MHACMHEMHFFSFLMVSAVNTYEDGGPGPAMKAGVKQYDLVLMVDQRAVNNLKELVVALKSNSSPVFTVRRLTFEYGDKSLFAKKVRTRRLPAVCLVAMLCALPDCPAAQLSGWTAVWLINEFAMLCACAACLRHSLNPACVPALTTLLS
jgi:hypothetical protein